MRICCPWEKCEGYYKEKIFLNDLIYKKRKKLKGKLFFKLRLFLKIFAKIKGFIISFASEFQIFC